MPAPQRTHTPQQTGILPHLRIRLFGEKDPVAEQLRDIARQGAGMARLAHSASFLLLILFSLGSLVALSGDAVQEIAARWGLPDPHSIPAAISVAVSTLLVVCMDIAALYAASLIRILAARRAERKEFVIHIVILVAACLLEGGTYVYMAWLYDRPAAFAAWILIIARAAAAPAFAVYLSLARPLPVGPRDILYQVELGTGTGVIRDAVTIANDHTAPLARKLELFRASAVMQPSDRERLDAMVAVLQAGDLQPPPLVALPAPTTSGSLMASSSVSPVPPPVASLAAPPVTTPHQPAAPAPTPTSDPSPDARGRHDAASPQPDSAPRPPAPATTHAIRSNVRTIPVRKPAPTQTRPPRADAGMSQSDRKDLKKRRRKAARKVLARNPDASVREIARAVAIATKHRCNTDQASELRKWVQDHPDPADDDREDRDEPGEPGEMMPATVPDQAQVLEA